MSQVIKLVLPFPSHKSMFATPFSKVTIESALSLIGGTLGLLTGFSILSGVEVFYFLVRFFMSLGVHKGRKKSWVMVKSKRIRFPRITFTSMQGCIIRLTCSHLKLTKDLVLTSAYFIMFWTVATNAVNKSVWRKKDCSCLPFNKHAMNIFI